ACRSQLLAVGRADCPRRELPEWPEGYGKLLRFPFGISDMKALKQFARALWQPDGTAASLPDGCTDRGFHHRRGTRCVSEMVGVHPVGGEGHRWSAQLWADAQDWCLAHDNCTGIMLYVGAHAMNCHYWCGRPQFCDGPIVGDEGTESSGEWNLFARGGPDGACGEDGASEGASDVGRLPEAAGLGPSGGARSPAPAATVVVEENGSVVLHEGIAVVEAWWRARDNASRAAEADVRDLVQRQCSSGNPTVYATSELFGDPAAGQTKALEITYRNASRGATSPPGVTVLAQIGSPQYWAVGGPEAVHCERVEGNAG
ncbi:unnamed protein product, partial [Prorocentrum cordatum]